MDGHDATITWGQADPLRDCKEARQRLEANLGISPLTPSDYAAYHRWVLDAIARSLGIPQSIIQEETMPLDRIKVCYVSEYDILRVLEWPAAGHSAVVSLQHIEIPPGAKIVHVFHSPVRRALGVIIQHGTFDPVPAGAEPPELLQLGRFCLEKAQHETRIIDHSLGWQSQRQATGRPLKLKANNLRIEPGDIVGDVIPGTVEAQLAVPHQPAELSSLEDSESAGDFFRRVMGTE